jgi:hypothetical protein
MSTGLASGGRHGEGHFLGLAPMGGAGEAHDDRKGLRICELAWWIAYIST